MHQPRSRLLFPLFAFLGPLSLSAQSLLWGEVVDCAPANAGHLRPRIALNAAHAPVVLWAKSSSAGCFAATAMGGVFMDPLRLNPDGTQLAAADWQGPAIASGGDTLWAVYKGLPEDTAPCYLVGSTNGGMTWSDTLRVEPVDGLVSRFPSVAVGAGGDAIVGYMQFTEGYEEPRQVVRAMADGAWLPVAQISTPYAPGEVCDCCTGEVAAAGDRAVGLYRNAGGNIRTIWGAASADGGGTFPVGAQVDGTNWSLAACPSSGPDAYIAGDSVNYVWMSGEDNGTKVYIGSAHAATLQTGAQANVHPGQGASLQQNFPRIAGSGDTLGVVWEQASGGAREVLFSWSVSGVGGLSSPDTVNSALGGAQETPDIAYAAGAFHIVWSEPATGQVRYRKAELVVDTGVEPLAGAEPMRVRYDAGEGRLYITGIRPRDVEVFNMEGSLLMVVANGNGLFRLEGLARGFYLVRAVDEQGTVHCGRFVR